MDYSNNITIRQNEVDNMSDDELVSRLMLLTSRPPPYTQFQSREQILHYFNDVQIVTENIDENNDENIGKFNFIIYI